MRLTTVLFLIGLVAVCSALNARSYQKYASRFMNQGEKNTILLEKSENKQEIAASNSSDPISSVLESLQSSKYKFTSKVQVQKSE